MTMRQLATLIATTHNPTCVGLDPTVELIPKPILDHAQEHHPDNPVQALADAYEQFNRTIIDAVYDLVPAVKIQVAMYEALGPTGLGSYANTAAYAQAHGLYVIGDCKRGDIGTSAAQYARHLTGTPTQPVTDPWHEHAITINPYLGSDGIVPFLQAATASGKAVFCLVHTSNPSAAQLQELTLADGQPLYERVGQLVDRWNTQRNEAVHGSEDYGIMGAVVGATYPQQGARLRHIMPHTMFLVPGYGAQGGTAHDIAPMLDGNGRGVLVNSSRGIIGAWRHHRTPQTPAEAYATITDASRNAVLAMKRDLATVTR